MRGVVLKGISGYGAIGLTSVMAIWCASVLVLALGKIQEPTKWSDLHAGGNQGLGCEHFQVLLQKHWESKKTGEGNRFMERASTMMHMEAWTSRRVSTWQDPRVIAK